MKKRRRAFSLVLAVSLLGFPASARADSPGSLKLTTWITDGMVYAAVATPQATYIGGNFNYVGPYTGSAVPIDVSSGAPLSAHSVVAGPTYAVISDGNGGWFIGGAITSIDGVARGALAHILVTGMVDTAWNPNVTGGAATYVDCLALQGSTLFIGGLFTSAGGRPRQNIAGIDVASGLATSWNPGADNLVAALAIGPTELYVGGIFSTIGGQSRFRLASLDFGTGAATAWNPNPNNQVTAFAIGGSTLYVSGWFTLMGAATRNHFCAFDVGGDSLTSWNPDGDGNASVLLVNGSTVYAGGGFSTIGGAARSRLAALDAASGAAASFNAAIDGNTTYVYGLAVRGSDLLISGQLANVGGFPRACFAAVDLASGNLSAWAPVADVGGRAIGVSGSVVFAGGDFNSVGGVVRHNVAALDPAMGQATSWNPNSGGLVRALAVNGSTVFAGGDFTAMNGVIRNHIAAIDAATGSITTWNPNASDAVYALALNGQDVYAGGDFISIGGAARGFAAAINLVTGAATAWNPSVAGRVKAISIGGSTLYAGGVTGVNALDLAGGAVAWSQKNIDVNAVALSTSTVYVGGNFTITAPVSRNRLAALDLATGSFTSWMADTDAPVSALLMNGSMILAGGSFLQAGGAARNRIAEIDAATGAPTAWSPNVDFSVLSLSANSSSLYAAGAFSQIDGTVRTGLGQFSFSGSAGSFPPQISGAQVTDISATGAVETWTTDQPSDSQVDWGLTTVYGNTTPLQPALVTSHGVTLEGLLPSTRYHLAAVSKNSAGLVGVSSDISFETLSTSKELARPSVNVFNPRHGDSARISLTASSAGSVDVWVYSREGSQIHHHVLDAAAGSLVVVWDGRNNSGNVVAPGTYLMRVRGAGLNQKERIVVVY